MKRNFLDIIIRTNKTNGQPTTSLPKKKLLKLFKKVPKGMKVEIKEVTW